jgi:nucleoside-diphosphate-sugar epimerase
VFFVDNKREKQIMPEERFFVTGALGCIGAWTVRVLVSESMPVTVFDIAGNPYRLRLIMSDEELARVNFVTGDIADLAVVERAMRDTGTTNVIHLAGLQVPFCKADPSLGARVNVVGTVNVFEAAKRAGLRRVVYASSVAVFGLNEEYPEGAVSNDAPLKPRNHYGVYKQANEGTARIYWLDDGITSIGFRPHTVYGPGRDQGMTSSPTKAMLAAALGKPYHIPFGGRGDYQYAEDVARTFIQATRLPFEGAGVFNVRGSSVHMREIVETIEAVEPAARGTITFDVKPLALPEDLDDSALRAAFGQLPETPFRRGVESTLAIFKRATAEGKLSEESLK